VVSPSSRRKAAARAKTGSSAFTFRDASFHWQWY